MKDDDCVICGNCWWSECFAPADYVLDVKLKYHGGIPWDGPVDLCAGHARYAMRTNHLNLNWTALEQAHAKRNLTI
jgi:hypothetical protein